jgi:hypothetical protein
MEHIAIVHIAVRSMLGAMTLSITTLGIMGLVTTLSITVLSAIKLNVTITLMLC